MTESTIALIEKKLIQTFSPTQLSVQDDSAEHAGHAHAGSGHYTVHIAASAFTGKNAINRHRMVYEALGNLMQTHIHALRIHAKSPKE